MSEFVDKTKYPGQSNLEPTRISEESYSTARQGDKTARNAKQCYIGKKSPKHICEQ